MNNTLTLPLSLHWAMLEHEFLEICKNLVLRKFNLPETQQWKQRDYEYLADLIFKKSGVKLSLSTLKRIWKEDEMRTPQIYTLNALAQLIDYESWNDFKLAQGQTIPLENVKVNVNPGKHDAKRTYVLAVLIVLALGYLLSRFAGPKDKNLPTSKILFNSKKTSETGVPNTVVFEYDISRLKVDSAFIQHSWDKRLTAKVSADRHFQTFIYFYPGYHTSSLVVNNRTVGVEKIIINTPGWIALVENSIFNEPPVYFKTRDFNKNQQLYLSPETLQEYGVFNKDKKLVVHYFNVGEFNAIDGEHFVLETRVKNSLDEGATVCQVVQVNILFENGLISIPFCHPGCVSNIHLHVSEVFKDGKQNDLSAFGIDLSKWNTIKIEVNNKTVNISNGNSLLYVQNFKEALGKVAGFNYRFDGSGAVDQIKVYTDQNELKYSEEF